LLPYKTSARYLNYRVVKNTVATTISFSLSAHIIHFSSNTILWWSIRAKHSHDRSNFSRSEEDTRIAAQKQWVSDMVHMTRNEFVNSQELLNYNTGELYSPTTV